MRWRSQRGVGASKVPEPRSAAPSCHPVEADLVAAIRSSPALRCASAKVDLTVLELVNARISSEAAANKRKRGLSGTMRGGDLAFSWVLGCQHEIYMSISYMSVSAQPPLKQTRN